MATTITASQLAAMTDYVKRHADDDIRQLMLKDEPGLTFDKAMAVTQIECRQRARNKIPQLLAHDSYIFAKPICAEQCTHEQVAMLHASLFSDTDTVLDMTMGQGVDSHYISKKAKSVTAIEQDAAIAEAGKLNAATLGNGVTVVEADSAKWLEASQLTFDAIFIDPARRSASGKRLFGLADCQPDVLSLLPLIRKRAKRLVIKASPMVDVTQGIRDLEPWVTDVWAVSVRNECKELLFDLSFGQETQSQLLHAVNYTPHGATQHITVATEQNATPCRYEQPAAGGYLLEPNASIMKIAAHSAVTEHFGVAKVAPNSHLYVSARPVADFPGRAFAVDEVVPWSSRAAKDLARQHKQLNVAVRNFRLTADALKKKLKVSDGGDCYAFATTTSAGEQVIALCHKVGISSQSDNNDF